MGGKRSGYHSGAELREHRLTGSNLPENAAKSRFLVVYDYGQGGVWAFVWARSVDEVHEKFRDLQVVDSMPSWLTGDQLAVTEQRMTFDIDDMKTDDWIARLLPQDQ
jgi:hypothetical protein